MIPSPSGKTRLYAVIGDPVAQVKAPAVLNQLFLDEAIDAVMVPVHVRPDNFPAAIQGLKAIANLDGILITIPHKFAVCQHLEHESEMVEISGAANALRRHADGGWEGENFDGLGFVAGLRRSGSDPRGRAITLVGAGGAGAAIAVALAQAGAARLWLTDVARGKADVLAARLDSRWPGIARVTERPQLDEVEIAVNATPLGLRDNNPLPFDVTQLSPDAMVAEVIMQPHETPLLKAAAARGLRVQHGIHMLTEQIELYRQFFAFRQGEKRR